MIAVPPRCDGCRRRDEDCIPSSATRGDRTKCEGCRRRRVPCTTTYNPQNSTTSTDRGNIRNPTTTTNRSRRTENNSIVRRPGIDYDIELIRDDFNIESLANRATTPLNREIPPTRVPHHMIKGAIRRREEEAKRREEENEAMRVRGEAMRRSVQEEVDRRGSRVPSLEEEMSQSAIDEAGSRIDSGGDYIMKDKAKKIETDARRLTSDVGEGGSSVTENVDWMPRFEEFYAMQLLILKKMGVYVDEEDIEEFKDLIKDINEGLVLLEEDIKKM
ncbi:hypothetical protein H4Q26_000612 [Puccinia striiformis f. sp. tritici PST-130]|nr:hypothetical protein H4Q26_000612 [Puccinia striiformis f. sp. tritici PST-130]